MVFTMKDVAEQVGVTKNTLFLWEKNKKIPKAKRDPNDWRYFTEEDVEKIKAYKNSLVRYIKKNRN